jgi:hypothetical protein
MGSKSDELEELSRELARLEGGLAAAQARMRELDPIDGDDDEAKTTLDAPSSYPPPPPAPRRSGGNGSLKAAAIGAGLMLGLVIVVLQVVNLTVSRHVEPVASAAPPPVVSAPPPPLPSATVPTQAVPPREEIPPPPPVVSAAPPPPSASPSTEAPAPTPHPAPIVVSTAPGSLTVVCTPRCESITDNNVLLGSNNVTNVPVSPGPHKLVLTSASGATKTVHVNVGSGQSREVRVVMETGSHDYGF